MFWGKKKETENPFAELDAIVSNCFEKINALILDTTISMQKNLCEFFRDKFPKEIEEIEKIEDITIRNKLLEEIAFTYNKSIIKNG